jgi:hypothetical protein
MTLQTGQQNYSKEIKFYSTKERIILLKSKPFDKTSFKNFMIHPQQDTPENLKPSSLSENIIGGWECNHSSRIMSKAAEFVNNSRLTKALQTPLIFQ